MKTIILIIIVGLIAFFALRSVYKLFTGKGGCGCSDGGKCSGGCSCGGHHKEHDHTKENHSCCGHEKSN